MAERRLLVAICHNHETVTRRTTQSLMELGWGNRVDEAKREHGFTEIAHAWFTQMPRVDALRNAAVCSAVDNGFSHVLFLDADMVWPTDVLTRMLRWADVGVVSGLYFLKEAPHAAVALRNGRPRHDGTGVIEYENDTDVFTVGPDGLRDEDVVGMGCTIIATAVFQAMGERPWFHYRDDRDGWPMVSEDVPFCEKARASGVRVAVDPTIVCGHVGVQVASKGHFTRAQQMRETSSAAALSARLVPMEAA